MEEIMAVLKENPTFYFATVEGYKPRVRPFGFAMEYKGRLYFAIGKHKAAYKQILDNTNIEICTANDRGEWLRIQGTVDFDNTEAAKKRAEKAAAAKAKKEAEEAARAARRAEENKGE